MDVLGALALAMEPNEGIEELKKEDNTIFNFSIIRNIIGQTIFQTATMFILIIFGPDFFDIQYPTILKWIS